MAQAYPTQPIKILIGFGPGSAPIALLGIVPNILVAHRSVPANNLQELIALAKSKPDSLTFGSFGYATASYMAAELFNERAGTKIVTVPYQGGSNQALSDLLSGRITLMFNVAATLAPHVEAGKLKAFAVAQSKRGLAMPGVPTLNEAGMSGYDAGIWIGLLAPAATPPAIIDKLSLAANDALKNEEVRSALQRQGTDPVGGTPKEFADFISRRYRRMGHRSGVAPIRGSETAHLPLLCCSAKAACAGATWLPFPQRT